jgi:MFS family permease
LRDLAFRRFWIGQTISLFGDQITLIALPLAAVLVLDAGPAEMGYLGAAALVPNILFSLHAGALVDRMGYRRQTMIAADLGRALCSRRSQSRTHSTCSRSPSSTPLRS